MNKEQLFKQWENEFYDKFADNELLEEEYFRSIAIGFFIAKGLNVNESLLMYHECVKNCKF